MEERNSIPENRLRSMLRPETQDLSMDVGHAIETVDAREAESSMAKKIVTALAEDFVQSKVDPSLFALDHMSHMINSPLLSNVIESARREAAAEDRRKRIRSEFSGILTKKQEKMQELICKVLLVASDAQTVTGTLYTDSTRVCPNFKQSLIFFIRHRPDRYCNGPAKVSQSLSSTRYL